MVCSIVRMFVYYTKLSNSYDLTWEAVNVGIWGQVKDFFSELNVNMLMPDSLKRVSP